MAGDSDLPGTIGLGTLGLGRVVIPGVARLERPEGRGIGMPATVLAAALH